MRAGKEPLSYSWGHLNNSEEPLNSIYGDMHILNKILESFRDLNVVGHSFGFTLITNNNLICYQSLEKAVHLKNFNVLQILYRQSTDLMYNTELLFSEIEKTDLGKLNIKERLRTYSAFCFWKRLKEVEKFMDKSGYTFIDGTSPYTNEEIDFFISEQSEEFHRIKDQINRFKISVEVSHLNKRQRKGELLHTFVEVIAPKYP